MVESGKIRVSSPCFTKNLDADMSGISLKKKKPPMQLPGK